MRLFADKYRKQVEAVMRVLEPMERGGTLTHDAVAKTTGIKPYERGWGSIIRRVGQRLITEREIALRAVVGVGYRLCDKDEQINDLPAARLRRARRQIGRGIKVVEAIDPGSLNDHQRQTQDLRSHSLRTAREGITRQQRRRIHEEIMRRGQSDPLSRPKTYRKPE